MTNERVLWIQRSSWAFSGKTTTAILLLFGGTLVFVGAFFLGGPPLPSCAGQYSTTTCGDPAWVFGIVIVTGGLFSLYRTVSQRDTNYYLTTFRLVRTSGTRIVTQISRTVFRGKALSQFPYIVPFNTRGGVQTYGVRILNPDSGDALMTLSGVPPESVNLLRSIGNLLYCQYCGRQNDAASSVCSNCGANL